MASVLSSLRGCTSVREDGALSTPLGPLQPSVCQTPALTAPGVMGTPAERLVPVPMWPQEVTGDGLPTT